MAFFLNLFNLIPVVPFDGGRAMAAVAPSMWFVGFAGLVAMILLLGNPFLLIFILLALREMPRRWRQLQIRSIEQAAYYRVPRHRRIAIGLVYIGLDRGAWFRDGPDPHPGQRRAQLPLDLSSTTEARSSRALGVPSIRICRLFAGQESTGHATRRDWGLHGT